MTTKGKKAMSRVPLVNKPIPKLKKLLDAEMSKYVRRVWSEDGEHVKCYTCDMVKPIKEMHSGHYISRAVSPTRYDPRNQRPQCPGCNTFREGMPHIFRPNLIDEIGLDEVLDLEETAKQQNWKWDRADLVAKIGFYKQENKELEAAPAEAEG